VSRRLGGRFVLEREIGAGGMSVIFLGRDEVLDRPVAVKVLRSGFEDSGVGIRFRREGRTAARLSHPNVVQVYDAGEDELDHNQVSYIVMEYVPGGDLGKLVAEKGPLKERELARIGADVASGLAHAHNKNIIHRDIKPQNILIDDYGRPKLADFGVARALGATESTQTGSYLGTASYSSPEQLRGGEITPKSDVYSLGCTLYETAVGEPPFFGGPLAVANQQLTKSPPPPSARGAALSGPLEALILDCLAKNPDDRPNADGLQERLLRTSALASGAVAPAPTVGETTRNLAEAAREAGVSGAAGATRGLGAVVRGLRDRTAGSTRASARTPVLPTQAFRRTFGRERNRRPALAVGAVALLLLALVAVVGAPALLGSGAEENTEQAAEQPQEEVAAAPPAAAPPAETTSASSPAPPPSRAEDVVYDMYVQASYQDPSRVWPYLSQRLQDEVGSPERWAERERLNNLTYVYFTQMPSAEVSGDKASVRFQVRETRTGESPRLVAGTWELVNEGGEWKLDRLVESNT
jgi:serine/threonine-protein kinase